MRAVEYYLTHDHITFSTEPKVSVYATNPQFEKICVAVANNDWIYVHGLLAIVKQEQRLNKGRHGFSIHSDEVLYNGRSVNYVLRLAIMHSIYDKQTQPAALHQLDEAMAEVVKFLETPLHGGVAGESEDVVYRDLEESSEEEMIATLHTDEDLDEGYGSWGDSWGEHENDELREDVRLEDGVPGGMDNDTNPADALDALDGGTFIQIQDPQTTINNDLEDLRQEYLKNKEGTSDDQ